MTAAEPLAVNSVTKSVASMLFGIAIEQGKNKSLLETVGDLLPAAAAMAPGSAARRAGGQTSTQSNIHCAVKIAITRSIRMVSR